MTATLLHPSSGPCGPESPDARVGGVDGRKGHGVSRKERG